LYFFFIAVDVVVPLPLNLVMNHTKLLLCWSTNVYLGAKPILLKPIKIFLM